MLNFDPTDCFTPTPTLWRTEYRRRRDGDYGQDIMDAGGALIATAAWYPIALSDGWEGTNREANARLIVLAVNSHDALVEALTKIAAFDDTGANYRLETLGSYAGFDEPGSVKVAREALARLATPVTEPVEG